MAEEQKLEALKTSVEMWVWDDKKSEYHKENVVYICDDYILDENGVYWDNYELIKETTYRPYNENDDLTELLGAKVQNKKDTAEQYIITGVHNK